MSILVNLDYLFLKWNLLLQNDIIIVVINMRKLIIILFCCLFLCGCGQNKYNDFEHYDLKEHDTTIKHVYMDDNSILHEYVITDITPEESLEIVNALFYKVAEDDYILLDEIRFCDSPNSYQNPKHAYFYNNKLYIAGCSGGLLLEYTLDGSSIEKVDLLAKLDSKYMLYSIDNVDDEYIYYGGKESISSPIEIIKCSRSTYECEK